MLDNCLTNNDDMMMLHDDNDDEEDYSQENDQQHDHAQLVFSNAQPNSMNYQTESLLAISSNLMTSSSNSVLTSLSSSSNNTAYNNNNHSNSNTVSSSVYSNLSTSNGNFFLLHQPHQHQPQQPQQQPQHAEPFENFTQPIEEWSADLVAQWLAINDLAPYIESFLSKLIDGEKLLSMDSSKLKALGVKSQKDRDFLKSKVKELKSDEKKRFKCLLEQQHLQNSKKKKLKN